jgi:putative chitinase
MSEITVKLLRAVEVRQDRAELFAPLLEKARVVPGDSFNTITSKKGCAMLVSQLAYESAYFSRLSENLNYSVEALRQGNRAKYFTATQARELGYVRAANGRYLQTAQQVPIANLYYGSRLGNRGVHTDDGWTFRGGGLIQLTGRDNYTEFGKSLGMSPEEAADYARTPDGAVKSALWYWRMRGLLVPASRGDVATCTRLIQGGDSGLSERQALFNSAMVALS